MVLQFLDGYAYNKKRMEEALTSGAFEAPSKKSKETVSTADVKKEHVELIVCKNCFVSPLFRRSFAYFCSLYRFKSSRSPSLKLRKLSPNTRAI